MSQSPSQSANKKQQKPKLNFMPLQENVREECEEVKAARRYLNHKQYVKDRTRDLARFKLFQR